MSSLPVLISGAGPSGLVLALALRRNGVNVRIIDRELRPRLGERGAGVSARSLELHRILGTYDSIKAIATKLLPMREHDTTDPYKVVRTFDLMPTFDSNPNAPLRNIVAVGQNHHERILREHLERAGITVELGSELRTFTQSRDVVTAEIVKRDGSGSETIEMAAASWLIGTDGARSVVRKTLGLSFLGETKTDAEMVVGDVRINSPPSEFWDLWGNRKTKFILLRPSSQDKNVVSFLIAGKIDASALSTDPKALIDELYAITGRKDIDFGEVIWASRYRPNIRMVDTMRVGRVLIAGDAAHCHSPAGGQGLNSSIQDSFNLGWKLALVNKGIADMSLLDTYGEERLPVIAQMLNKTTELLKHTLQDTTATAEEAASEKELRKDLNQLSVGYRASSIVYHDASVGHSDFAKTNGYNLGGETDALPGDRAPEAPGLTRPINGATTCLFNLFSPSRHTAIVFSGAKTPNLILERIFKALQRQPADTVLGVLLVADQDQAKNNMYDETFVDAQGHAFTGYHVELEANGNPLIVIVRPDGVIGARVRSEEGVERYFQHIFKQSMAFPN